MVTTSPLELLKVHLDLQVLQDQKERGEQKVRWALLVHQAYQGRKGLVASEGRGVARGCLVRQPKEVYLVNQVQKVNQETLALRVRKEIGVPWDLQAAVVTLVLGVLQVKMAEMERLDLRVLLVYLGSLGLKVKKASMVTSAHLV